MSDSEDAFLGPFELVRIIGAGGMGEVFEGIHTATGESVAIKVTRFDGNPSLRRAFAAEISAMARLYHPGIVQIYDWGSLPDGGGNWCAMDLASHSLTPRDIRSWTQLRRLLEQVLDALGHAHARNIVHRDLKPANVLVFTHDAEAQYQIADFGLAYSRVAEDKTGITGMVAGTPVYMAPEQLHGLWREFGPWTDLYALGCMAFELATGYPPFNGSSLLDVALAHIQAPTPELHSRFPVPEGFERWLQTLLRRDWMARPKNALAARGMLDRLGEAQGEALPYALPDHPATTFGFGPTELAETLVELGFAPAATLEMEALVDPELETPPIPNDWRVQRSTSARFHDAGSRLVGLRETGFVGHTEARDEMWARLRRVVVEGTAQVVILADGSERELNLMTKWFTECVAETTALQIIQVDFGVQRLGRDPFRDAIEILTVSIGLRGERLRDHLSRVLRRHPDELVARVTNVIESDPNATNAKLEARDVFSGLLESLSAASPLVVVMDGIDGDPGFWFFLEYALRQGNRPILFVLKPANSHWVESATEQWVRSAGETISLAVQALSEDDARYVLDSYIQLEPSLRDRWVQVVMKDIGFAMDTLRYGVGGKAMETTPAGYSVRKGFTIPESPQDLLALRLRHLKYYYRPDLVRLITVAPILGHSFSYEDWGRLAKGLDILTGIEDLESLLRTEFLKDVRGQYLFLNDSIRQHLLQSAQHSDVTRLLKTWKSSGVDSDLHRVESMLLTGAPEDASRVLIELIRTGTHRSAYARWITLAKRVNAALPDHSPLETWIIVAEGRLWGYSHGRTRSKLLLEVIDHPQPGTEEAIQELKMEYSVSLCYEQRIDEAKGLAEALLAETSKEAYPRLCGEILSLLGWISMRSEFPEKGEALLEESLRLLESTDSWLAASLTAMHLAMLPAIRQDYRRMLDVHELALDFGDRSGALAQVPCILLDRSFGLMVMKRHQESLIDAEKAWRLGRWAVPRLLGQLGANYALAIAYNSSDSLGAENIIDETLKLLGDGNAQAAHLEATRALVFAIKNDTRAWDALIDKVSGGARIPTYAELGVAAWEAHGDSTRAKQALSLTPLKS